MVWYSDEELDKIGIKHGKNVLIDKSSIIVNPEQLKIVGNTRIDAFCLLIGKISVGRYCHIAPFVQISANYNFEMKDFAGLGSHSVVHTSDGDYTEGKGVTNPTTPLEYRSISKTGPVIMGKHSIIGDQGVVLPGVEIGEGATFGALSLLKDPYYEPWKVHVGIPAKPIKDRPKETILKYEQRLYAIDKEQGIIK